MFESTQKALRTYRDIEASRTESKIQRLKDACSTRYHRWGDTISGYYDSIVGGCASRIISHAPSAAIERAALLRSARDRNRLPSNAGTTAQFDTTTLETVADCETLLQELRQRQEKNTTALTELNAQRTSPTFDSATRKTKQTWNERASRATAASSQLNADRAQIEAHIAKLHAAESSSDTETTETGTSIAEQTPATSRSAQPQSTTEHTPAPSIVGSDDGHQSETATLVDQPISSASQQERKSRLPAWMKPDWESCDHGHEDTSIQVTSLPSISS